MALTGDASANSIQIWQDSSGSVKVQGIGTKVDGSFAAQTFPGITDIAVDLLAGNDFVKVFNLSLVGSVQVEHSGGGNKTVQASNFSGENFRVTTLGGNDSVVVNNLRLNTSLNVSTDGGNDVVAISQSRSGNDITVDVGSGNNSVSLNKNSTDSLDVEGGDGNDTVVASNSTATGLMNFNLTGGNDVLALNGLQAGDAILAYVANGNNVVTINKCTADSEIYVFAQGSPGHNLVSISNSTSTNDQVSMDLAEGADVVTLFNVSAAADSYIHANGGNNVISINKLNVAGEYTITSLDGNDTIAAANTITGTPEINAGNGNNVISFVAWRNVGVSDMSVATGNGRDSISIVRCSSTIESLYVNAGDGTNTCVIASCPIAGAIGYTGKNGRDYLTMTNSSGIVINVSTGDDTDVVSLASVSTSGGLFVNMGPGNYDTLAVANCSAATADLDGGGNTGDTLVKSHNHFGTETDTGFQHVIG